MTVMAVAEKAENLPETLEARVLLLAPVGRDGPLTVQVLQEAGFPVTLCHTIPTLCQEMEAGAGAVLITTEALREAESTRLIAQLKHQPPWSDLPIVLLSNDAARTGLDALALPLGNVTVLERPLSRAALLMAIRAALRARQRQYQVRDLLAETERARAEAERQQAYIETLNERLQRAMTETHHRVKNNLQIIAAMIDMQMLESGGAIPIDEMKRLGMHIRVLASVHDLLTQEAKRDGEAQSVSSQAVLEQLITMIRQTTASRPIRYHLQEARLAARQCTAVALIVNELVSNALKYGTGTIEVFFEVAGDQARLKVCDDGEGFPADFDPATAANTGLELVERLARWDLSGQTRYQNLPQGGACVVVTMPL
ncbi:MAG TPA: sensor histidine kinase [Chthonomonadaceae bacterium]|nr:sensor histidine kinase [Chthonomonadaceae bacterium]